MEKEPESGEKKEELKMQRRGQRNKQRKDIGRGKGKD